MAILIEGVCVVVRRPAIDLRFPGGWPGFVETAPEGALCADRDLARLSFMDPKDMADFIRSLEALGFAFMEDGEAVDLVVVDQTKGIAGLCDWAEFGLVALGGDPSKRVAACRSVGTEEKVLMTPDGWSYEGSLSQTGSIPR